MSSGEKLDLFTIQQLVNNSVVEFYQMQQKEEEIAIEYEKKVLTELQALLNSMNEKQSN